MGYMIARYSDQDGHEPVIYLADPHRRGPKPHRWSTPLWSAQIEQAYRFARRSTAERHLAKSGDRAVIIEEQSQ